MEIALITLISLTLVSLWVVFLQLKANFQTVQVHLSQLQSKEDKVEGTLREEISKNRTELNQALQLVRQELHGSLKLFTDSNTNNQNALR